MWTQRELDVVCCMYLSEPPPPFFIHIPHIMGVMTCRREGIRLYFKMSVNPINSEIVIPNNMREGGKSKARGHGPTRSTFAVVTQ